MALINSQNIKLSASTDSSDVNFFSVKKLTNVAFDHKKIIEYGVKRLRWKFEYTAVAFSMLPRIFTMSQIQELYETVFDKKFDKRNFAKKILSLGILKQEGLKKDVSYRPPMLYSLKKRTNEIIEIL
jgi:8-oxo-dGTP diphosphatase